MHFKSNNALKPTYVVKLRMSSAYSPLDCSCIKKSVGTVRITDSGQATLQKKLVVALLVKMGYGGSIKDAGKAVGKTGDEGIDGIIKEDKLGLDVIYIQAKRWKENNIIGRPEIHKFVGALAGQGAKKGILIDGMELANLMIEYNLGVAPLHSYELKRIDGDYFDEI